MLRRCCRIAHDLPLTHHQVHLMSCNDALSDSLNTAGSRNRIWPIFFQQATQTDMEAINTVRAAQVAAARTDPLSKNLLLFFLGTLGPRKPSRTQLAATFIFQSHDMDAIAEEFSNVTGHQLSYQIGFAVHQDRVEAEIQWTGDSVLEGEPWGTSWHNISTYQQSFVPPIDTETWHRLSITGYSLTKDSNNVTRPRGPVVVSSIEFYSQMADSIFCLVPAGEMYDGTRLWGALETGCIPVFDSTHAVRTFDDDGSYRSQTYHVLILVCASHLLGVWHVLVSFYCDSWKLCP